MECVTNCMPLPLYVDATAITTFVRCRGHEVFPEGELETRQPRLIGHRQYISNLITKFSLNDFNLKEVEIDSMQKVYRFNKKFVVDKNSFDPNNNMAGFPQRTEDLSLFSDGSKLKFGQCGSGLAVYKIAQSTFNDARWQIPIFDLSRHLEENTIFIAEVDVAISCKLYN